jgi:hypothetical protein
MTGFTYNRFQFYIAACVASAALIGCGRNEKPVDPDISIPVIEHKDGFSPSTASPEQRAAIHRFFRMTDQYDALAKKKMEYVQSSLSMTVLDQKIDRFDIINDKEVADKKAAKLLSAFDNSNTLPPVGSHCHSLKGIYESEPVNIGDHLKRMTAPVMQEVYDVMGVAAKLNMDLQMRFQTTEFRNLEEANEELDKFEIALENLREAVETLPSRLAPHLAELNQDGLMIRGRTIQMGVLMPNCARELGVN